MRLLIVPALLASALLAQHARPPVTDEEIAQGKRLFQAQCGGCHGPQGQGGQGPSLVSGNLKRATDTPSLYRVIRQGIRGTEMPRVPLHDLEVWKVVAYVETLGKLDSEPAPGDPAAGEALYRGKGGCAGCHWLDGSGGRQGPELSEIGARRSVAHLREALLEPAAATPSDYLLVTAVERDGGSIQGVRLNEDPFTIQIRDFADAFHSLRKADLAELTKRKGESSMPSYRDTMSETEIDDLVSFLASLKGGR